PLAELLRQPLAPPRVLGVAPHSGGDVRRVHAPQPAEQLARRLSPEERRTLKRDLRVVQRLLEIGQPGVRATENGDLLERNALLVQHTHAVNDECGLALPRRKRLRDRLWSR